MDEILNYNKKGKKVLYFIGALILILGGIISYFIINKYDDNNEKETSIASLTDELKDSDTIDKEEDKNENATKDKEVKIKVDIKGAINNPGVYEVSEDTIVNELINMAGGLMANATTKNINLSRKLQDEMVVIIYTENELKNKEEIKEDCLEDKVDISSCYEEEKAIVVPKNTTEEAAQTQSSSDAKVSLNKASKEELMTLSGIGEAKALKIIAYRESNDGFKTIDELMEVSGIGESIFNKIKERLTL